MVPGQNCSNCLAFCGLDKTCRSDKPAAIAVPAPNGALQTFGFWPPTQAQHWCLKWEPEKLIS